MFNKNWYGPWAVRSSTVACNFLQTCFEVPVIYRLLQKKNQFPAETPDQYWPFRRPVVDGDTLSTLAKVLDPEQKKLATSPLPLLAVGMILNIKGGFATAGWCSPLLRVCPQMFERCKCSYSCSMGERSTHQSDNCSAAKGYTRGCCRYRTALLSFTAERWTIENMLNSPRTTCFPTYFYKSFTTYKRAFFVWSAVWHVKVAAAISAVTDVVCLYICAYMKWQYTLITVVLQFIFFCCSKADLQ